MTYLPALQKTDPEIRDLILAEEQREFDKIIVTAGSPDIPESLTSQLAMNGKLIIPTGNRTLQQLVVITKTEDGYIHTNEGGCTFVPLIGDEGWQE